MSMFGLDMEKVGCFTVVVGVFALIGVLYIFSFFLSIAASVVSERSRVYVARKETVLIDGHAFVVLDSANKDKTLYTHDTSCGLCKELNKIK